MCAHKYGHPKFSLIKVFKISSCSWEQGLQIQLKSNIELFMIIILTRRMILVGNSTYLEE